MCMGGHGGIDVIACVCDYVRGRECRSHCLSLGLNMFNVFVGECVVAVNRGCVARWGSLCPPTRVVRVCWASSAVAVVAGEAFEAVAVAVVRSIDMVTAVWRGCC